MRPPLVLREHTATEVEINDALARRVPIVTGGRIGVRPAAEPGRYFIDTAQYVGSVVLDDLPILVRPKIPLHNLFLLLTVGVPSDSWRDEWFGHDRDESLLASIAEFFARTAERTLARGLLHSYRVQHAPLVALRGRLDLAATFRQPGIVSPVPCSYDDFTVDIDENRVLRAATRQLLRLAGVAATTRSVLLRLLVRLEGVADVHVDGEAVRDLLDRRITRLNSYYEPALRLSEIILRNASLIDRSGRAEASAFLLDMNALFQRFLTERLRQALVGRLEVQAEPREHLDRDRQIVIEPDLVFAADGERRYVGDVKYKLSPPGRAYNSDLYQLLAYCTALGLDEGLLIYCLRDETDLRSAPKAGIGEYVVRRVGTRLRTYHLDMSGGMEDVERSISGLADWIAHRSTARRARPGRPVAEVSARVAERRPIPIGG
ncbi:MAG: restriction endonuclease [Actinobacteria bacterium]|nr:MAG: restriction endonuclease [Actinomycetota bacterium]